MLTIERTSRTLRGFPPLALAGLAVLAIGGAADVAAHVMAAGHAGHGDAHTAGESAAHAIVLAGMVLVFLGVVFDGVRQTRARRSPARRPPMGVA